jgi:hypothetical protein
MERGSAFRSWLTGHWRRTTVRISRVTGGHLMRKRRLFLESLEDRRLMAVVTDGTAPLSNLAVDSTAHSTSSLIVQFKPGTSSPGSLAAYVSTAKLSPEWALTPRHAES